MISESILQALDQALVLVALADGSGNSPCLMIGLASRMETHYRDVRPNEIERPSGRAIDGIAAECSRHGPCTDPDNSH